jgi:alanine racemase
MIYLNHLCKATNGVLYATGKQDHFDAFSHDTRQLIPGELFVAVRSERGDGHDYLLDATRGGASGLLVEGRYINGLGEEALAALTEAGVAIVVVNDTRLALQQYARFILDLWHPTVIAVTGSTGKTSTKEAIAAVLSRSFATFKSWQNYNDLLGLPLSLGWLDERHEYAVLELACDHPGEIVALCQIAQPSIGVLTNISPTQLQYFDTVERLSAELCSLLTFLLKDGAAIVNGDDSLIYDMILNLGEKPAAPIKTFAPSTVQNVRVAWEGVRGNMSINGDARKQSYRQHQSGEHTQGDYIPGDHKGRPYISYPIHVASHLLGKHHIATMMAAYVVGQHCGLQAGEVQAALANLQPLPGRINPLQGVEGSRLLDDTHNAAPASVIAGLETLRALPTSCRIAVLGDILRLGDYEDEAHRLVGEKAARCVDYLILRGEKAELIAGAANRADLGAEQIIITSTHEDAAQAVRNVLGRANQSAVGAINRPLRGTDAFIHPNKLAPAVLIKGSEETRMERVTELLMAQPEQAREQLVRQTPGWKQIVVMRPERPTWVEIDLSAIASNTRRIKSLVGPGVSILASLKADAYGHGALKVARTVLHNGASMLGVATVSEATPLREAGISAPILVFGYVPHWQMREAVRLGLTITLYSIESAQALSRAAQALKQIVKVHIKVDTGMGRLGIRAEQVAEVLKLFHEIIHLPGLELEGIFTHFAMADTHDQTHARMQLIRFQHILHALEEERMRPPLVHAANSAAILSLPESHFDMVRPGIALYGLDPSLEVRLPEGFRPALSFKTQVAQVKVVPEGECISYGCNYITDRPTRVAVLPVGYADGFRRGPANWGSVLVHGQEAPLLGRVCMDQCMIDVSHIPQVRVGDEVVLIGQQEEATLTAEQVAQRLGTNNYEVVSEILARVPRVD